MTAARHRAGFAAASLCLYGVSLALRALLFEGRPPLQGYNVLAWGWWGVITFQLAWFANPAYVIAILKYISGRRAQAIRWSAVALALGSSSLFAREWWFDEGSPTPIQGLGFGFWLWLSSFAFLLACSLRLKEDAGHAVVADAKRSV